MGQGDIEEGPVGGDTGRVSLLTLERRMCSQGRGGDERPDGSAHKCHSSRREGGRGLRSEGAKCARLAPCVSDVGADPVPWELAVGARGGPSSLGGRARGPRGRPRPIPAG